MSVDDTTVVVVSVIGTTVYRMQVPYSMCTSSDGYIIVSDSENRALLALQQDGEKRFIFQPPK